MCAEHTGNENRRHWSKHILQKTINTISLFYNLLSAVYKPITLFSHWSCEFADWVEEEVKKTWAAKKKRTANLDVKACNQRSRTFMLTQHFTIRLVSVHQPNASPIHGLLPKKADGDTVPLLRETMTLIPVSTKGTEKSTTSDLSSLIVSEPMAISARLYTT